MIKGTVAIVGRPNVGKSTIFNRLTRSRTSIVDDRPGVTRDRIYGTVECVSIEEDLWNGYTIIDTGGFETETFNFQPFASNIVWQQTENAIETCDIVLLVFDGKDGLTPHDRELLNYLRAIQKPVVCVINKIDGPEQRLGVMEFYELGLGELPTCSAAHNRNIWALSEKIEEALQTQIDAKTKGKKEHQDTTKVAIIGRPNAGKSSILNRLTGEERAIVSEIPGTTRDNIDISIVYNSKHYQIVDTAGIRRKTKISDKIESLSVLRSLRVIDQSDVVILVITSEGLSDQDARLASLTLNQHKPLLIVVNKWDLIEEKTSKSIDEAKGLIHTKLKDSSFIPILFTSCIENKRVHRILKEVEDLASSYSKRAPTSLVNECLAQAVRHHTPALIRKYNKRVKFFYATQVRTSPPTIVVKCNVAGEIQESYKRYLTKNFRQGLGFGNVPIRVIFRGKDKKEALIPTLRYTPTDKTREQS